jgi:hypothetical protein
MSDESAAEDVASSRASDGFQEDKAVDALGVDYCETSAKSMDLE